MPSYRVALICIGVAFTLTGLYTGSELAAALGLSSAIRAVIYGSIILTAMSVPAAMVGARTRLSTYMIVSHVFGVQGARAVNLVLAMVLLGWYAVTAELFGRTFFLTAAIYLPVHLPQWCYTLASSVVVIATTIFGFRAIDRLSLVVAPLLVMLTSYVAWRAIGHVSWAGLLAVPGAHVDFGTGVSAVVGAVIVNVVLMPDLTRYARSTLDCMVISFAGTGIGVCVSLILAMIPALAFHEIDPMKYMAILGLVGVAFAVLVASTWTNNAVNLYSTGLVTSTVLRKVSYGRVVIGCGAFGSVVAIIGIADRLIDFLVALGLIVPPIAAVYLTDFFVLHRQDYTVAAEVSTNLNGLGACLVGGTVGLVTYVTHTSLTGVPTIESFVSAATVYAIAEAIRAGSRRDRLWRPGQDLAAGRADRES